MRKIAVEIKDRRWNLVEIQDRMESSVLFDEVWFEFFVRHLGIGVM